MMLTHEWNGHQIRQKENGFVCLTEMANSESTDIAQYFRLQSTTAYISALAKDLNMIDTELIILEQTTRHFQTWVHPEIAIDFARWVSIPFRIWANRVIREVIYQGGHIRPDATQQQLEVFQVKIQSLQEQNKLLAENRQLTGVVRDFMLNCLDYAPNSHVRSAEWSPVFKQWVQSKYGKDFYEQLNPTGKEVIAEMDRILKSRPESKKHRMYVDAKNGISDLENARLRPKHERELFSSKMTNYSSDIGE